jgi:hypothetical protein
MASMSGSVTMLGFGSESGSPGKNTGRVRSRVACRGCNQRKVRCDVTRTGNPCSNCRHDTAICEVLPRKKHRQVHFASTGTLLSIQIAQLTSLLRSRPRRPRIAPHSSQPIVPPNNPSRENIHSLDRQPPDLAESHGGDHGDHRLGSLSSGQASVQERALGTREPESSQTTFPPIDAEEVLPDDSSLTYIGM